MDWHPGDIQHRIKWQCRFTHVDNDHPITSERLDHEHCFVVRDKSVRWWSVVHDPGHLSECRRDSGEHCADDVDVWWLWRLVIKWNWVVNGRGIGRHGTPGLLDQRRHERGDPEWSHDRSDMDGNGSYIRPWLERLARLG